MVTLPSELLRKCSQVFARCDQFKTDASLRAMFVTSELAPFRDRLPSASAIAERVDTALGFLMSNTQGGQPLLFPFLLTLRDKYQMGDGLRDDLENLARVVGAEVFPRGVMPPTAPLLLPLPTWFGRGATNDGVAAGAGG